MFHEIYVFSLKRGLISIFLEIKWLFYPQKCNFAAKKLCKFEFCVTRHADLVTTHKNGVGQPFLAKKGWHKMKLFRPQKCNFASKVKHSGKFKSVCGQNKKFGKNNIGVAHVLILRFCQAKD